MSRLIKIQNHLLIFFICQPSPTVMVDDVLFKILEIVSLNSLNLLKVGMDNLFRQAFLLFQRIFFDFYRF